LRTGKAKAVEAAIHETVSAVMEQETLTPDHLFEQPSLALNNTNERFFTTENFLDMYENITEMLDAPTGYFFAQIHKWAEGTDHATREWVNFFNSEVLAVHNSHLGQKEWQYGQVPQTPILTAARKYIQAHPQTPFPGWAVVADRPVSSPGKKRLREESSLAEASPEFTPTSPAKKRAREEETVTPSPVKMTEEANVKRQRVERTALASSSAPFVEKTIEEVFEEISQSIETSIDILQGKKSETIDLTAISSSSSSDSDDEEEVPEQPAQLPPDSEEEMFDEDEDEDENEDEDSKTYGRETQAILSAETQALDLDIPEPDGGFASSDDEDENDEDPEAQHDQDLIDLQIERDILQQNQVPTEDERPDLNVPEPEDGFEPSGKLNVGNIQMDGGLQWAQSRWDHIIQRNREGLRADVIQQQSQVQVDEDEDALPEDFDDETILETPKPRGGFTEASASDDEALFVSQDTPSEVDEEHETHSQAIETFDDLAKPLLTKGYALDSIFEAVHHTSANKVLLELVLKELKSGRGILQDVRGVWTEDDDTDLQSGHPMAIQRVEGKHGRTGPEGWKTRLRFLREEIESQED
jgi:hypothetical protein